MRKIAHVAGAIAVLVAALVVSATAGASGHRGAVFVETNDLAANQIVVYDRSPDGTLSFAAQYGTGGKGGAADGAVVDKLASQGALTLDLEHSLLFAVNAGSDSLSVFTVDGNHLALENVLPTGGSFPVSVTVNGNLVYVLNAGGAGSVSGYRIDGSTVHPINNSTRSLGLDNGNPPFFLASPGQVGFSPDGSSLIVTTKGSGSAYDVFSVLSSGRLGDSPVVTPSATPAPFAFAFDPFGRIVATEAGTSTVSTYTLNADGTLTLLGSQPDNQVALCWITGAGSFFYGANAGSNTISGYTIGADGKPALVTGTGVVGQTEAGAIDMAATPDGSFVYSESGGAGTVDAFAVNGDGTLTKLQTVTGLPAGIEGIALD